jgi:small subunit ribosomal protein S13
MEEKKPQKQQNKEDKSEFLIRILHTDIPGTKNVYSGLTRIKGVSFSMSNAICHILEIDKKRKIESLSKQEIDIISEMIKNPEVPTFMKNRRKDFDEGVDRHLSTNELDLRKEFDIKRLMKIKCYKGNRHSRGLPVRGQRTKSHFRKKGKNKAVGVKTKK